jgi:hypothetical protein
MLGADTSPVTTGSLFLWPQSNLIYILHYLIVLALPYYLVINYNNDEITEVSAFKISSLDVVKKVTVPIFYSCDDKTDGGSYTTNLEKK